MPISDFSPTPQASGGLQRMRDAPLIAGNWKMNGTGSAESLASDLARSGPFQGVEVAIFPPACYLERITNRVSGSGIRLGGQDCHTEDSGAFTGDISAAMLRDCGAELVILGHSERRHGHAEPCSLVSQKAEAAMRAGLLPLICIGETLNQRQTGQTETILRRQLRDSLPATLEGTEFYVSYEPVWAIGTGRTASDDQIADAFAVIHDETKRIFSKGGPLRTLYGGSVKPDNAARLFSLPGVGGALVGGAALNARAFLDIIAAASQIALKSDTSLSPSIVKTS